MKIDKNKDRKIKLYQQITEQLGWKGVKIVYMYHDGRIEIDLGKFYKLFKFIKYYEMPILQA